jgi:DNA-binding NtrC family response regulator
LISDLLAHSPPMKILVLSGQNDAANARHARALGAAEFVAKPCDPGNLKKILLDVLQFRTAEITGEKVAEADPMVGASPALQKLKSQVSQYANSPFPALIEGESGTGKEVVANLLHRLSWRRSKPWFALNCAAIAPTLVEPTLFGYTKGAFTGATQNKSGYFEDAGDGTLFLDEIGELPLELQAKLLRVLENGEFQRVGETQQRFSRARVIAATNRESLSSAVGIYDRGPRSARDGRRPITAARAFPQVLRGTGETTAVHFGRCSAKGLAQIPLPRQRA